MLKLCAEESFPDSTLSTSLPSPCHPEGLQEAPGEEGEVVQLQAGAVLHLQDPAAIQTQAVLVL